MNKIRLQFELPEDKVEELDKIMEKCSIETRKELFNNALTLFEWAVEEVSSGNVIASVDEEKERYRVLQMPVLNQAKKRVSRGYVVNG